MRGQAPERVRWGMWKRFLLGGALVVLLTATATATAVLLEVNNVVRAIDIGGKAIAAPVTAAAPGAPQTLLVIGSDRRFRDRRDLHNARSDTIILVRLNAQAGATTIMSIPRDLKAHIRRPDGRVQTDKINAAYSVGGPSLTASTVMRLLSTPGRPFRINHVVNVNFGGFRAAVDALGCVYADIDRRYFNDNNPPVDSSQDYATINIKPGYQRLCGSDALDYVRFRHLDTDIVRAARQQDFLRQAKQQFGTSRLFASRARLAGIFGRYTQTDTEFHSERGLLKLLDLAAFLGPKPIQEVHFPAIIPNDPNDPYVRTTRSGLERAVRQFMGAQASAGPRGPVRRAPRLPRRRSKVRPSSIPGLIEAAGLGRQQVANLGAAGLPVYFPRLLLSTASYVSPSSGAPRAYRIRDLRGHVYPAYRMVLDSGRGLGNFLGVQGTTWLTPPILRHPSEIRVVGGRSLQLFFDGSRLRLVAWRTTRAVYWISNTLQENVGNAQMLGMAASLAR